MKFEDIPTNAEGLKKLIDYLNSDENSDNLKTEPPEKIEIFSLNEARHIGQAGNTPSDRYSITVDSVAKPSQEDFRGLSELLMEIYAPY